MSSHSGPSTRASGPLSDGPARSTPHSSKTSRTAAATYICASAGEQPRRSAHSDGDGPAHGRPSSPSRGSTEPPGKTIMLGAKSISGTRRSMKTSGPVAPSRTSITVLARRGAATSQRSPASQRRAAPETPGVVVSGKRLATVSVMLPRPLPHPSLGDGDDDLDLDGCVQWERSDSDSRTGVNPLVAEGRHEQLAGTVDDAGLAGEGG